MWLVAAIGFFGVLGKGTPAPFDSPRRLVVPGPHRYMRNPMYVEPSLHRLFGAEYEAYCANVRRWLPGRPY